jgi:mannosyltransferase OCH1-like enzyme
MDKKYKILIALILIIIIITIILCLPKIIELYGNCLYCKTLSPSEKSIIESTSKNFISFSNIPKNIFQTWEDEESIPPCCLTVINKIRENNPDWNYKFYSAEDRRNLIINHFDEKLLHIYDNARNKAQQSDIFRYCVLYQYGGLYLDIKAGVNGNLNDLGNILSGKILYCKWPNPHVCNFYNHAATSILLWPKKHPIMKSLIKIITNRMLTKPKGGNTCIVGPDIYAMVMTKYFPTKYMLISNNYLDNFFSHDGTNGEYYEYVHSRKLHWHQNQ